MSYEAEMFTTLLATPDVVAIVGNRIYPGVLPSVPTLPALTYQLISAPRNMTQEGPSGMRPRYRWNCFAYTYDETTALAKAVALALKPFRVWIDQEDDHHEQLTGLFRRRLETLSWTDAPEESA